MIINCLKPRCQLDLVKHVTRQFKTLKSKDDERNAQDLLKRLQKLAVTAEKRAEPPPTKTKDLVEVDEEIRCVNFDKLVKLVTFYQKDPLTWNPSVLGRIYRIPENICENVCFYVRPVVFFATTNYDEVQRLRQTTFVIDVGRYKTDDNYLKNYKRIVFPKLEHHD